MQQQFEFFSKLIYFAIAVILMLFAVSLVMLSAWGLVTDVLMGQGGIFPLLHSVGLLIVSVAIFDISKFIIEEEILRERELRSIREARKSLTKFMTIIIIAVSLEALVIVFEAKQERMQSLLYPGFLLIGVVAMLVGLGVFQWLSSKADALRPWDSQETEQASARARQVGSSEV
jgi:heme/copper-type cytochrome/quinol oxidase subunit 4